MPKLTINSVCTKGDIYPIIFNIQNDLPSQDFEYECAILQDECGNRIIAAESSQCLYVGDEVKDNTSQYLLLVKNRKTGKVRIIETENAVLKPVHSSNLQLPSKLRTDGKIQTEKELKRANIFTKHSETNTDYEICNSREDQSETSKLLLKMLPNHSLQLESSKNNPTIYPHHDQQQESSFQHRRVLPYPSQHDERKIKQYYFPMCSEQQKDELEANKILERENLVQNMERNDMQIKRKKQSTGFISKENNIDCFKHNDFDESETYIYSNNTTEVEIENLLESKLTEAEREPNNHLTDEDYSIVQNIILKALGLDSRVEENSDKIRTKNDQSLKRNVETDTYVCDYCENVFDRKSYLIVHLTSHEFIKHVNKDDEIDETGLNNKNDYMSAKSKNIKEVDEERKKEFNDDKAKNDRTSKLTFVSNIYICDYCENIFDSKDSLIVHLTSHEFIIHGDKNNQNGPRTKNVNANRNYKIVEEIEKKGDNDEENIDKAKNKRNSKQGIVIEALGLDSRVGENEENKNVIDNNDEENSERTKNDETSKRTVEINTYICDYCENVFDTKSSLIVHLINHEFAKNADNDDQNGLNNKNGYEHANYSDKNTIAYGGNHSAKEKPYDASSYENNKEGKGINQTKDNDYENIFDITPKVTTTKIETKLNENGVEIESNNIKESKYNKVIKTKEVLSETEKDTLNNYISNHYEEAFEEKELLNVHLATHELGDNIKEINEIDICVTNPDSKIIHEIDKGEINKKETLAFRGYICDYCEQIFENKSLIIDHIQRHQESANTNTGYNKFICDTCKHEFKNDSDLINHKIGHGLKFKYFSCKYCDFKTTSNNYQVKLHMQTHDASVVFNCEFCRYTTVEKTHFKRHVLSHTREMRQPCGVCNSMFKHSIRLIPQIKGNIEVDDTECKKIANLCICNNCGLPFKNKALIITHIEKDCQDDNVKTNKKYKFKDNYNLSNSTFLTKSALINHDVTIHDSKKSYKTCTHCEYKTTSSYLLKVHHKIHTAHTEHEGKRFSCTICDRKYQSRYALKVHKSEHAGEKLFKCRFCDLTFVSQRHLNSHIKTHAIEKIHKCTFCESKFYHLNSLNRHLIKHTGLKCENCNASFKYRSCLKLHVKSHTGDKLHKCTRCESNATKRFQCDVCNVKFTTNYSLKVHNKIHTGEKKHKCEYCDSAFITAKNLRRHVSIHTKGLPFNCSICVTSYKDEKALKSHMTRMHKPIKKARLRNK